MSKQHDVTAFRTHSHLHSRSPLTPTCSIRTRLVAAVTENAISI